MLRRLPKTCDHTHAHQPLAAGRTTNTDFQPTRLLQAILHGMIDTTDSRLQGARLAEEDWDAHLTMAIQQPPLQPQTTTKLPSSSIPTTDGGTVHIHYHPHNFKQQYLDEYTREVLPLDLVKAAVVE